MKFLISFLLKMIGVSIIILICISFCIADIDDCFQITCSDYGDKAGCISTCCCTWCNSTEICNNLSVESCAHGTLSRCDNMDWMVIFIVVMITLFIVALLFLILCCVYVCPIFCRRVEYEEISGDI